MKKTLCLAAVLSVAGAMSAFCGQQFDAAAWRGVQTYDVSALTKMGNTLVGKVVGVRFNYRGDRINHLKPNWYESDLWQQRPGEKGKFPFVRVMVEKKDLPAFKTIPTFKASADLVVYGEVQHDARSNFVFVRLLGSKVTLDASGNATVDW